MGRVNILAQIYERRGLKKDIALQVAIESGTAFTVGGLVPPFSNTFYNSKGN